MSSSRRNQRANLPVDRYFPSDSLVIGAGVTIFHLATATERVVLCHHSRDKIWFLPKGRRDASEDTGTTACREGFEESGYRNRLLPLPIDHIQPNPLYPQALYSTEPIATRMMPVSTKYQYILFWYAAETLPEHLEISLNSLETPSAPSIGTQTTKAFAMPPPYPNDLTLKQRIVMDARTDDDDDDGKVYIYEPRRHEGTGVDEEEALYESFLLSIPEALRLLGGSSRDVLRRAWDAVLERLRDEAS